MAEKRPEVVRALSAAAAEGDRSENAEYQYRKKQLGEIDRRVRYLSKRLEALKVVEHLPTDQQAIFFGAWIELENIDNGESLRYRIVGPDETDATLGWISIDSPLARAVLKKRVDDEFEVAAAHRIDALRGDRRLLLPNALKSAGLPRRPSPNRSCSSVPMISTSTNWPGFKPASLAVLDLHQAVDFRRVGHRTARWPVRRRSHRPGTCCTMPTLRSSFSLLISACSAMKRARRSCFTSSGTGSGSALALAPSTGE